MQLGLQQTVYLEKEHKYAFLEEKYLNYSIFNSPKVLTFSLNFFSLLFLTSWVPRDQKQN